MSVTPNEGAEPVIAQKIAATPVAAIRYKGCRRAKLRSRSGMESLFIFDPVPR
jgi:hypothetical protein